MISIKGKNGSYFHNNILFGRNGQDELDGVVLIDNSCCEDIICRLNGYAIIPLEEYYQLKGEPMPEESKEKIKRMQMKLKEI